MKQNTISLTQSKQREAQRLLASLTPAHLAPTKPFAYVVSRTSEQNPFKGAFSRISFVAETVDFVRDVLVAMRALNYETGFAVYVNEARGFQVVGRMPTLSN